MSNIIISPEAKGDLLEIWNYVVENSDEERANQLLRAIREKFVLLEQFPQMGKFRHEILLNLRSFPFKKYVIFYAEIEQSIEIVRVLHSSRNIEGVFDNLIEDADSIN